METKAKRYSLLEILSVIIVVGGLIISYRQCRNTKLSNQQNTNFINSLSDSVSYWKNKDSSEKATISVLQFNSTTVFLKLKVKDSIVIALQQEVSKYKNKLKSGSSVTIGTTTTSFQSTSPTIITEYKKEIDTVHSIVYSEYSTSKKNKWIDYTIKANKDSTTINLLVTNQYATIIGYDKKKPFVDVINFNPYSTTKVLRTYQVNLPTQKVWGIGLSAGIGISMDLKPRPYIGVGVNYNLIKF